MYACIQAFLRKVVGTRSESFGTRQFSKAEYCYINILAVVNKIRMITIDKPKMKLGLSFKFYFLCFYCRELLVGRVAQMISTKLLSGDEAQIKT